ncbi:MAG: DUF1598 domain-containing protein, partial [Planctomycetales bacterium]|nr:DUF1598 domain-containing protein [Planctomycetales bacterium]
MSQRGVADRRVDSSWRPMSQWRAITAVLTLSCAMCGFLLCSFTQAQTESASETSITRPKPYAQATPVGDVLPPRSTAPGNRGGAAQADFDTLIDLIETTIAPDTWETVGGEGAISGFPGGVYVDPAGVLRQIPEASVPKLEQLWQRAARTSHWTGEPVANPSPLRCVSLRALHEAWLNRNPADTESIDQMLHLAGLERIDRVLLVRHRINEDTADSNAPPALDDVVLAGPAGPWTVDRQGRHVSKRTGRPVLRLEDWVHLLRNAEQQNGRYTCSITPTETGLAAAQRYATEAAARPLRAGQRRSYLDGLRESLGLQRVEIQGLDPNSRVARVLVEADHHMKKIGIGLEPGTDRVTSYLDRLVESRRIPQSMDILRWWFTLAPDVVTLNRPPKGDETSSSEYLFAKQAVQVLSENELLSERGERVHTGTSDELTARFAHEFTADFAELGRKYPVYADLDNLFRWSIVAALVHQSTANSHAMPSTSTTGSDATPRSPWTPAVLLRSDLTWIQTARAARWVPSIINDRSIDRRQFVAVVSGGVQFDHSQIPT